MPNDLIAEAEEWLVQLLEELAESPEYKYPPFLMDRVCSEIATYAPNLRQAVLDVLAKWLESEDTDRANRAASIVIWCEFADLAPHIRKFADRLEHSGRPQAQLRSKSLRDSADFLEVQSSEGND